MQGWSIFMNGLKYNHNFNWHVIKYRGYLLNKLLTEHKVKTGSYNGFSKGYSND